MKEQVANINVVITLRVMAFITRSVMTTLGKGRVLTKGRFTERMTGPVPLLSTFQVARRLLAAGQCHLHQLHGELSMSQSRGRQAAR